jgi:hypothetical protein
MKAPFRPPNLHYHFLPIPPLLLLEPILDVRAPHKPLPSVIAPYTTVAHTMLTHRTPSLHAVEIGSAVHKVLGVERG